MPDLTYEELLAAIAPKADQLNADDVVPGPITVEILGVRKVADQKQPYHIDVEGYPKRPWKPCKTMLRLMAHVWSEEADRKVPPSEWIGRRVTLYCDPEVTFKGHKVGGIRISHLSHISKPYELTITITKSNRKDVTIYPIGESQPTVSPEDEEYIAVAKTELAGAQTMDELVLFGDGLKKKSQAVRDALRPLYAERQAELKT